MDPLFVYVALGAFPGLAGLILGLYILAARSGNPEMHTLRARLDALEASQSDLVDRYEHYQRRVNTRFSRLAKQSKEEAPEVDSEALETPQGVSKLELRRLARAKGMIP